MEGTHWTRSGSFVNVRNSSSRGRKYKISPQACSLDGDSSVYLGRYDVIHVIKWTRPPSPLRLFTLQGIKKWEGLGTRLSAPSRESWQNLLAYRARAGTLSAAGPCPLWAFTRLKIVANRMDVKINSEINMAAIIFSRTKLRSAIKKTKQKKHRTRAIKFTVAMQFFAWNTFFILVLD